MSSLDKIIEKIKDVHAVDAIDATTAFTKYNGEATTTGGVGIDTRGYNDIAVKVNAGLFSGDGTVDITVLHADADDWSGAALVAGCTFTQITTANDQQKHSGSINRDTISLKRYIWIKDVKGGTGSAAHSVDVEMSRPFSRAARPESNSPVFDV